MIHTRRRALAVFALAASPLMHGCGVMVAAADAQQQPPTTNLSANAGADRTFSAAVQALAGMGQVTSQDRSSGLVQGKKGSWLLTVTVSGAGSGSRMQVSARFVPSNQVDLNSREGLTNELISRMEGSLGERFSRN